MYKPKPIVALTCLLDLLFVLVFSSLLLVEPPESEAASKSGQAEQESDELKTQLAEAAAEIEELIKQNQELQSSLAKLNKQGGQSQALCVDVPLVSSLPKTESYIANHCKPNQSCYRSCNDILRNGESLGTGLYTIDADGAGEEQSFTAYCEMELEGGGWTLYAHHQDCIPEIQEIDVVSIDGLGVMPSQRWEKLRDTMEVGMMFMDENMQITTISRSKLLNSACRSITNTPSLVTELGSVWHDEKKGCSGKGMDYSYIRIAGKAFKNYEYAGASLYQRSSMKFDKWPYPSKNKRKKDMSVDFQNELVYFLK